MLLQRLTRSIEPVPGLWPAPRHLFTSGTANPLETAKSELRQILLHSNQAQDIEAWLEQLIRGSVMLVDNKGWPYVRGNNGKFEHLLFSLKAEEHDPQTVPLADSEAAGERGCLYLWPSVDLPPMG